MRSATDIIIPTQMEDKPIGGVFGMLQLWAQENNGRQDVLLNLIEFLPIWPMPELHYIDVYMKRNKVQENVGKYLMLGKLSRRITFAENDKNQLHVIFDLPTETKQERKPRGW